MSEIHCNSCNGVFNYNIIRLFLHYLFSDRIHIVCPVCGVVSCYWLHFRVVHDVVNEDRIEKNKEWSNP